MLFDRKNMLKQNSKFDLLACRNSWQIRSGHLEWHIHLVYNFHRIYSPVSLSPHQNTLWTDRCGFPCVARTPPLEERCPRWILAVCILQEHLAVGIGARHTESATGCLAIPPLSRDLCCSRGSVGRRRILPRNEHRVILNLTKVTIYMYIRSFLLYAVLPKKMNKLDISLIHRGALTDPCGSHWSPLYRPASIQRCTLHSNHHYKRRREG